jgi:hypothetical protein
MNLKQMKINYLYNPFTRIAGLKSLITGLFALLLTTYLSFWTGTHFNGLSNIDFAKDSGFIFFLVEHLSSWISISIFFYLSGLFLSKSKIRVIDILGTLLFARIPLIITPLIRIFPFFQSFVFQSWEMYLILGIYLFSLIWTIILLFNGFKISCNLKNVKLITSFIISLIIAEITTRLIIIAITFKT